MVFEKGIEIFSGGMLEWKKAKEEELGSFDKQGSFQDSWFEVFEYGLVIITLRKIVLIFILSMVLSLSHYTKLYSYLSYLPYLKC